MSAAACVAITVRWASRRSTSTPVKSPKTRERQEAGTAPRMPTASGRVRQLEDEPRQRDVLHPRAAHGDDLAGEEEPVVAVVPEAREGAAVGAPERGRHAGLSSRPSIASGSSAASEGRESARPRGGASGRRARRCATCGSSAGAAGLQSVRRRPTRRRSPSTGARGDEPGRFEPVDVAASSRAPTSARALARSRTPMPAPRGSPRAAPPAPPSRPSAAPHGGGRGSGEGGAAAGALQPLRVLEIVNIVN